MSTETMQQIAALIAFCLLMLLLNLKSGSPHWTSTMVKVGSFWLMVAAVALLAWRVAEVAL